MMGDSHAALFGHGVRAPGAVKATYGTGSSLMTLTDAPLRSPLGSLDDGRLAPLEARSPIALEGNISVSAQAAAWMAELMGLAGCRRADRAGRDGVRATAASCFVPALAGLGAPHWKDARARRALRHVAGDRLAPRSRARRWRRSRIQIADVFAAMEQDLGAPLDELSVDGGATRNDLLMQMAGRLSRPAGARVRGSWNSAPSAPAPWRASLAGCLERPRLAARVNEAIDTITPQLDEAERASRREVWSAAVKSVIAAGHC